MSVRTFDYYSFCGRTVVCGNAMLVSSFQEAIDTVNYAHQRGVGFEAGGSLQMRPFYSVYTPYWDFFQDPVVGHVHGQNYPSNWVNSFGIEIPGDYKKFALTANLRRLERTEFDLVQLTALGKRAMYMEFTLTNLNTASSQTIARIFNNKNYMYSAYSFVPATTDFDWNDLTDSNLFTFSILDDITLTQTTGSIEHYLLSARVNYKESPDGNAWNGSEVNNGYPVYINQRYHPATGDLVTCDGVIDLHFTAYK